MKPLPLLAGLLLALPFAAVAKAPSNPSAPIDIPAETFKLDNGLTVIVHTDRKAPIVAVNLWYHVGSKNERPGRTGFAHLFEHLMFQGSEHNKGEFISPLEALGATDLNGTTDFDRTNYFENIPTTALDTTLWLESDRMGHLLGAIDQKVLDEQRGVVQNEKREGDNSPYGKTFESMLMGLFPEGHPYRWEIIGSMDDLNAATLTDVKHWFETWYGPANTVLVLAGDIDVPTAKEKVTKYFGDIPPGPAHTRLKSYVPELAANKRELMHDRVGLARVMRAWTVPGVGGKTAEELGLAARILGGSKTSRLNKRLVLDEQVAASVAVYYYPLEIAGLFVVQADAKPGVEIAQLEAMIDAELARFLKDGPTAEEVKRSQSVIQASVIRGAERIGGFGGKADILAECFTYTGNPHCYRESLSNLATATPASIAAQARQWLSRPNYTLEVQPFPDYKPTASTVDRKAGVPATTAFPDLAFPNIQRGQLANGVPVVLAERHETPVVQVRFMFDAGYAADFGRKLGTAGFTLGMLDEGTGKRNAVQIAEEAELLGAQFGTYSSLDASGLGLSALSQNLQPSLNLVADLLMNPSFPSKEMERVRGQWLANLEQEKKEPNSQAMRVLPPLIYGDQHPYGIPLTGSGTEASIKSISADDMRAFHRDFVRPDNLTIVVVGDTDMAAITAALNEAVGSWKPAASARPTKSLPTVERPKAARVFLIDKPNAEQSLILAGETLPPASAPDYLQTNTAISAFGGLFSARLNMNLREDKHWAYGAYAWAGPARGQRLMSASAGVQSDKTIESLQEMQREFVELVSTREITADELQSVINNDVRSLPGYYETSGAVTAEISNMVLFGRPDDYVRTMKARTEAQTLEQVRQAAKQHIDPNALTWVIVGDLKKIEAGIRALKLGEVQVIDPDASTH
ncbi:M16 family metallopeptidase [Ahniella affigens]|nr:pitrilysin family protein [Ahniella affigens]